MSTQIQAPTLARLVRVEMRKTGDTRAGRWLLGILGLLGVAVVVLLLVAGERRELTFETFLYTQQLPIGVFLPVLGILAVTGEWSQRTALTTFTLVPRRPRIVVAKVLALVAIALLAVAVSVAAAAVGNLIAQATTDADGDWGSAWSLGRVALFQVLSVLIGVGLGMLLLSAPQAIVAYLLLPLVVSTVASFVGVLQRAVPWINPIESTTALLGDPLSARTWGHIVTSVLLWAVVPLLLGAVRVQRREVQ